MSFMDFYNEKKWCGHCNTYVRYLMSVNQSFCVQCGHAVKLFNTQDLEQVNASLEKRKWKGAS